jgi:hypothetical protein
VWVGWQTFVGQILKVLPIFAIRDYFTSQLRHAQSVFGKSEKGLWFALDKQISLWPFLENTHVIQTVNKITCNSQ